MFQRFRRSRESAPRRPRWSTSSRRRVWLRQLEKGSGAAGRQIALLGTLLGSDGNVVQQHTATLFTGVDVSATPVVLADAGVENVKRRSTH
jgi:hypothetical protein